MSRYGIDVAEDVEQAEPRDKIFSTDYQSLKVAASYYGNLSLDSSGNGSVAIGHDLLYAPAVLAWVRNPSDLNWYSVNNFSAMAYTSVSQVKLVIRGLAANSTVLYKFWIFTDPAEE